MFSLEHLRQSNAVIMAIMILVIVTGAIETDIFVPSFSDLMIYFNTTETMVQVIVGINFIGLCLSSLVYGPLTDSMGRRRTLLIGMVSATANFTRLLFSGFAIASSGLFFTGTILPCCCYGDDLRF